MYIEWSHKADCIYGYICYVTRNAEYDNMDYIIWWILIYYYFTCDDLETFGQFSTVEVWPNTFVKRVVFEHKSTAFCGLDSTTRNMSRSWFGHIRTFDSTVNLWQWYMYNSSMNIIFHASAPFRYIIASEAGKLRKYQTHIKVTVQCVARIRIVFRSIICLGNTILDILFQICQSWDAISLYEAYANLTLTQT